MDINSIRATENARGENMVVSTTPDAVKTLTFQQNGWTRINIYYSDGTSEELYEK